MPSNFNSKEVRLHSNLVIRQSTRARQRAKRRTNESYRTRTVKTDVEEYMDLANSRLFKGQHKEAMAVYDQVIQKLCPGHPVALLNRALCFLALGYPELAAMDSYRAAVISNDMRNPKSKLAEKMHSKMSDIVCLEQAAILDKAEWVKSGAYDGKGPGRILIDIGEPSKGQEISVVVCNRLEVRALYRLCYCLWKCGGAAIIDAIGLISDALQHYPGDTCDLSSLKELGNTILHDTECLLETKDKASHDSLFDSTYVRREQYPWNTSEAELEDPGLVKALDKEMGVIIRDCNLVTLRDETCNRPRLALTANREYRPGEALYSERIAISAVNPLVTDDSGMFCDNCTSLLILSADSESSDSDSGPDNNDNDPIEASSTSSSPSTSTEDYYVVGNMQGSPRQVRDSGRNNFQVCEFCGRVPYCSDKCHNQAHSNYHLRLCDNQVEGLIRTSRGTPEQKLQELLLVRIFAKSLQQNKHPLELEDLCWLNGNLSRPNTNGAGAKAEVNKTLPWSFERNVVRPIRYLQKMNVKPETQVKKFDGWVINTLYAKILSNAIITKGPPEYAILYNCEGAQPTKVRLKNYSDQYGVNMWKIKIPMSVSLMKETRDGNENIELKDNGTNIVCLAKAKNGQNDGQPSIVRGEILTRRPL